MRNETFARELGRALHRPALLRMPASLLRMLAGDLADELLLGGQRVLPDKAEATGFKFRHETLPSALSAMLGDKPASDVDASNVDASNVEREFVAAGDMQEKLHARG